MRRFITYIIAIFVGAFASMSICCGQTTTHLRGNITGGTWNAGTYILDADAVLSSEINTEGNVIIDLNGHVLSTSKQGLRAIVVNSGTLTIIDSNPNNPNTGPYGKRTISRSPEFTYHKSIDISKGENVTIYGGIITSYGADKGGIILIQNSSTCYLKGGTLASGVSLRTSEKYNTVDGRTEGCGGAVYVDEDCTFIMDGGHIAYSCTAYYTWKSGNTEGWEIQGKGGAVFIDAHDSKSGRFELRSGSIYGCRAVRGAGVYIHTEPSSGPKSSGFMLMSGGVIKECTASVLGGGVMVPIYSLFEMRGGTICNNETTGDSEYYGGAGVFVNNDGNQKYGTFKMYNGVIENNKAKGRGCGVHSNGVFEMYGGLISGNSPGDGANYYGGGVFTRYASGKFTMSGGTISGNSSSYGGGVALGENSTFTMSGGTIENNTAKSHGCGVYSKSVFNMSAGNIRNNFPADWDLSSTYTGGVCGGGAYLTGAGSKFEMSGGIISENKASSGAGVMVWEGSTMNMTSGELSNNNAINTGGNQGNGGAVYVQTATFELNGGTISGNTSKRYGGAININSSATLNLIKGTISGNHANYAGGVAQEAGNCNMTIAKDVIITGNTAQYDGGGIFVEMGKVELNGCTIENNKAVYGKGGGMSLKAHRVQGSIDVSIKNDTQIIGNSSNESGGAIDIYLSPHLQSDWTINQTVNVNFESGLVDRNWSGNGGALHIYANPDYGSASMTIGSASSMPEFKRNCASLNGGAIAMDNGTMTIIQGNFYSNMATENNACGGAVYLGNGTMNIQHAEFEQNYAKANGGCIYMTGTLDVNGKVIIKNNAAGTEAGAILVDGGSLRFADCEVYGNKSGYDFSGNLINSSACGGALSIRGGSVEIDKGTVKNNQSALYGGGLYVYNNTADDKTVNLMGNGSFVENTAVAGGGVYAAGKINMNMHADVNQNTATTLGGGIYLDNITKLVFSGGIAFNVARNGGGIFLNNSPMEITGGIIRNNRAVIDPINPSAPATDDTKPSTGYLQDAVSTPALAGLGGGIFLNTGSTLKFDIQGDLGVYENDAVWGADDIFANGNGTSVTIPDVSDMNLTGYRVPTTRLHWAEDYITNDTKYSEGTALKTTYSDDPTNQRYDDAIMDMRSVYVVDFEDNENYKTINKYLSLEVGYELIVVELVKEGLSPGESAVLVLTPAKEKDGDGYKVADGENSYVNIIFVCKTPGQAVKRKVALPSGWWEFKETDWTWAFNNAATQVNDVSREKWLAEGNKLVYTFTNTPLDSGDNPKEVPEHSEDVQINRMRSVKTAVGQ